MFRNSANLPVEFSFFCVHYTQRFDPENRNVLLNVMLKYSFKKEIKCFEIILMFKLKNSGGWLSLRWFNLPQTWGK